MQIESLTEKKKTMSIEELRTMWKEETNPDKRKIINEVGLAIKKYGNKFGSLEVGGNSFCYSCFFLPARVGHYNCPGCAGETKVNYLARSLQGMQQALLERSKEVPLRRRTTTEEDVMNIFEIR